MNVNLYKMSQTEKTCTCKICIIERVRCHTRVPQGCSTCSTRILCILLLCPGSLPCCVYPSWRDGAHRAQLTEMMVWGGGAGSVWVCGAVLGCIGVYAVLCVGVHVWCALSVQVHMVCCVGCKRCVGCLVCVVCRRRVGVFDLCRVRGA